MKSRYLPHTKKYKEWRVANTPDLCPIMGVEMTDPCIDHNHQSGMIRGVISRGANTLIGKVENVYKCYGKKATVSLPDALRRAADYLEQEDMPVLHPKGCKQLVGRFKNRDKDFQFAILWNSGFSSAQIENCRNQNERAKLYEGYLKEDSI